MKIRLYKRGRKGLLWADLRPQGIGRVALGTPDKAEATRMVNRMLAGIEAKQTLTQALDRAWHEHYRMTKGSPNVYSQMGRIKHTLGWGGTALVDITTPVLVGWRQELLDAGRSAKTANRYLALISKVLQLATTWGTLDAVPHIPRLPESTGRLRTLSGTEFDAMQQLFAVRDPWMAGLTRFLLDTGCRLGESLRITENARESALQSGRWTVWETKGGKPRTIPLTGAAMDALMHFHWAGKKNVDVSRAWNRARAQLGLDKDPEFVPHALRHTRASQLVNDGHDLYKVAQFLGHSSVKVTEKYAHLNTNNLDTLIEGSGCGVDTGTPTGHLKVVG